MQNQNFLTNISKMFPNATLVAKATVSRHQPDTLDDAREKVIAKALASKSNAVVDDDVKQDSNVKFDTTSNTYTVGLKYGNRWLKNIFGESKTYLRGLTAEQKDAFIDELVKATKNGDFDTEIEIIRKANKYARTTKH